ncbi:unnamed protein product, partial [Ectocarpus sp. 4 AP-2014]
SPRARPRRGGVPAALETAGVSKDIELDNLVAYTKESTADWLEDIQSDYDDDDGRGSEQSSTSGVTGLRPVP